MRLNKASLCLSALLVLGGCPNPEESRLTTVTVTCAPASVEVGQSAQCTASATDQDGEPFTVSGYDWTSSNDAVATVGSKTGLASTHMAGTVTITAKATSDGVEKQGQATLSVTQQPPRDPTVHTNPITANETWRVADNPHVVRGYIDVNGATSPTLTIEAGVELRFEQDAGLRVTNGILRALGTQEAPIRMVSSQAVPTKGHWRGVVFATGGSEMNHVMLSDCGRDSGEGACIALQNKATPVLRNVTVRNSGTAGVEVADDGSAFGSESTMLSVSGSESYAVRIGANQAGTIPGGGTFTGNAPNAIELQGDVSHSQTWANRGIPYVVNDFVSIAGATSPTLTLAPGTMLRFGRDYGLYVGDDAPGELIVGGTVEQPVLLTANAASPTPGHWRGVHLMSRSSNKTSISHATIEYAGASGSNGTANLNVYGNNAEGGARPIIDTVVVRNGSANGVFVISDGGFGAGSTKLSAHDNGGYAIGIEANFAGTLPTGGTFSGNAVNAVDIREGNVTTTQTWPNLGIPYVINEYLEVGFSTSPTLTLPAGTELRFGADYELSVGVGGPGALIAEGTVDAPIRFVPNTATPTKGYWRGLHFWDAAGSKLNHVRVSHAGASGSIGTGNLNVYREIGEFVTNSMFSDSSGCGITVSTGDHAGSTPVTTNFLATASNNTFSNNTAGRTCTN